MLIGVESAMFGSREPSPLFANGISPILAASALAPVPLSFVRVLPLITISALSFVVSTVPIHLQLEASKTRFAEASPLAESEVSAV